MPLMPELLAPEWTDKADKASGTVFLSVVVSGVLILWCSLKTEVEEIKLAERSLLLPGSWSSPRRSSWVINPAWGLDLDV